MKIHMVVSQIVIVIVLAVPGATLGGIVEVGDMNIIDDAGNASNGLRFLDVNLTRGKTQAQALADAQSVYSNVRLATPTEFNGLFSAAGITFIPETAPSDAFEVGDTLQISSSVRNGGVFDDIITTLGPTTFDGKFLWMFTVPDGSDNSLTTRDSLALQSTSFNAFQMKQTGNPAHLTNVGWLLVTEGLLADLTHNGFVDFDDLSVLLSNWDQDASAALGNLVDADGTPVNFDDLAVLLSDWTGPDPAGSPEAALGAAAVPEPSALLLAVIAAIGVSVCRRRRNPRTSTRLDHAR